MTNDHFFRSILIPAGQVLTLSAKISTGLDKARKLRLERTWDTLNLVACWSMTAGDAKREAVRTLVLELVKEVQGRGLHRLAIVDMLKKLAYQPIATPRQYQLYELRAEASARVAAWDAALTRLQKAIDFTPSECGAWLERHAVGIRKLGRSPAAWRTYVRNSEWRPALALMGIETLAPANLRLDILWGSHEGRARLPALWQQHFGSPYGVLTPEQLDPCALPAGVLVRTNAKGYLEVQASAPDLGSFTAEEQGRISEVERARSQTRATTSVAVPQLPGKTSKKQALRDTPLIGTDARIFETGWEALPAAVTKAVEWRAECQESILKRLEEAEKVEMKTQLEAVRKKFLDTFTPAERKLLLEKALVEAPSAVPAKKVSARRMAAQGKPATKRAVARKTA